MDSLLGLSTPVLTLSTITPGTTTPFLTNLFLGNDTHPENALFTAALPRLTEPEGFFTFGYIDDELVGNETIRYAPIVADSPFWEFAAEYKIVNGQRIETPG